MPTNPTPGSTLIHDAAGMPVHQPFWKNPYEGAVPIALGTLLGALLDQYREHPQFTKFVHMYFQFGPRLDAYVIPSKTHPTVGIRFGNDGPEYMSPSISVQLADKHGINWRSAKT